MPLEETKDSNDASVSKTSLKTIGARHIQVVLLFLGVSVTCAARFSISVAVVAMTDAQSANSKYSEFDWDSEKKSLILSSFFWGYVFMQIPSGYVANKYGAHKLLCYALLLSSILNALTPLLANQFDWIAVILCRIGMGLFQSCLIPCTHTLLSRWTPANERARLGSLLMMGPQFGNILSMSTSGLLASSSLGWPSIFYVFGILNVVWVVVFYIFGAESPAEHSSIDATEREYIEASLGKLDKTTETFNFPWKAVFTSVPIWALIFTRCGQAWGFYIFLTKMPSYMKSVLKFDIKQSGLLSALPYLTMVILSFPFGWFCDFILKKDVPTVVVRKISNTIAMWGGAISLIVLCLVNTTDKTVTVLILVIIVGLDVGNICGFEINHIDLSPKYAGTLIAILNTIGNSFGEFSPIACGYIVTDENDANQWHVIFFATAGIYFVANLIFISFAKAEPQPWNNVDLDKAAESHVDSLKTSTNASTVLLDQLKQK